MQTGNSQDPQVAQGRRLRWCADACMRRIARGRCADPSAWLLVGKAASGEKGAEPVRGHADGLFCPLCSGSTPKEYFERLFGRNPRPPDYDAATQETRTLMICTMVSMHI